jgi:hypothetical protein
MAQARVSDTNMNQKGEAMAEMKFLPAGRKPGRFLRWILLGFLVFIAYVTLGNSTGSDNLQQFVRDRSQVDVVRYSDFTVGAHSRVVIVRDSQDGRTAMTFVKVPFLDRWNLTEQKKVTGEDAKPIAINIDDGFIVLQSEVSFDRVNILGSTQWSGTYAKSISIGLFILLAVGINWWLSRYKRMKVI